MVGGAEEDPQNSHRAVSESENHPAVIYAKFANSLHFGLFAG